MALDRLIPNSSTPGSILGDAFMDATQEELSGLWDRAAIKLSAVGGTGDAVTATVTPGLTGALVDGMLFTIVPIADNTTATTLKIGAATAAPVVDRDGTALTAGQFRTGRRTFLLYDGTSAKFHILGDSATASSAVRIDFQTFTANGTWTKPAGYSANGIVVVDLVGGGGGGGAAASAGGGGGGAGVTARFRVGDLAATQAVSVGAGGAVNLAGGTSSFFNASAFGGGAAFNGTGGGGAGGGAMGVGGNSGGTTGGNGGSPGGGVGGTAGNPGGHTGSLGGGGGGGSNGLGGSGGIGGGGGGGGGATPGNGGIAVTGGGGGAGANAGGGTAIGGVSQLAGAGGAVNSPGVFPGGGGGRNAAGAGGRVNIWTMG